MHLRNKQNNYRQYSNHNNPDMNGQQPMRYHNIIRMRQLMHYDNNPDNCGHETIHCLRNQHDNWHQTIHRVSNSVGGGEWSLDYELSYLSRKLWTTDVLKIIRMWQLMHYDRYPDNYGHTSIHHAVIDMTTNIRQCTILFIQLTTDNIRWPTKVVQTSTDNNYMSVNKRWQRTVSVIQ